MRSLTTAVAATVAFSGTTNAFFRMECFSRTALARMDPLVNPGEVSRHAHVIHGGVSKSGLLFSFLTHFWSLGWKPVMGSISIRP